MATHSSVLAWRTPGTGESEPLGCSLWGRTESDTTEATQQQQQRELVVRFILRYCWVPENCMKGANGLIICSQLKGAKNFILRFKICNTSYFNQIYYYFNAVFPFSSNFTVLIIYLNINVNFTTDIHSINSIHFLTLRFSGLL